MLVSNVHYNQYVYIIVDDRLAAVLQITRKQIFSVGMWWIEIYISVGGSSTIASPGMSIS